MLRYAAATAIALLAVLAILGAALSITAGKGHAGPVGSPGSSAPVSPPPQGNLGQGRLTSVTAVNAVDIPVAGISTSVRTMPASCRTEISPPVSGSGFRGVFQCRDFANPLVLAGHTSKYTGTVLNRLTGARKALPGSVVIVNGKVKYRITAQYSEPKSQLPRDARAWTPKNGKLVIVTCDQSSTVSGPASENFIVVAQEAK